MADDENNEQEEEGARPGKKKLILIIAGSLLLIGIATGVTLMLINGEEDMMSEAEEAPPPPRIASYVDMQSPFTVNLEPEDPVDFLQISLQILTYDEAVAADLETHTPLIRNNIVALLGEQNSVDLRAPEGKEKLQKSVLGVVQSVIDKYGSGGEVDNVFFTAFVMQ